LYNEKDKKDYTMKNTEIKAQLIETHLKATKGMPELLMVQSYKCACIYGCNEVFIDLCCKW